MSASALPSWLVGTLRAGAVSLGLGLLFSFLGVYGTTQFPFGLRVVYWTSLLVLGWGCASIIRPWVFERALADRPAVLQIAVASLLIALPVTAGLLLIDAADGSMPPPAIWPTQYLYALAISGIMMTGGWAAERLGQKPDASPAGAAEAAQSGTLPPGDAAQASGPAVLADRLPVRLRTADIHAVSAEDHYLRVHTSGGEELILLRLSDAIRELAGIEGLQVHRSWWVARQGVAEVKRDDGRMVLKLRSGVEAPVSRTYLKAVRDAGWA